jgi:membrane associated rhomboid family serine protease
MLENRDYMRAGPDGGSPLGFRWTASAVLIVLLIAAYALQCINEAYLHSPVEFSLGLTKKVFTAGYVWQLITFQFLHGGLLHLFCNLLGLWFFGRFVENVLGVSRFLIAYLGAGVVGGLLNAMLMALFPEHFGEVVFGASAGVAGLFAIFACLESEIEVRLYFVLPMRAKTLLVVFGIISVFFTVVPVAGDGVAHAAHLGGIVAGLLWVKFGWHIEFIPTPWEAVMDRLRKLQNRPPRRRPLELVRSGGKAEVKARRVTEDVEELPPAEFISREVDPILDKISAHGLQSLTERERKILDAARKKMEKK